MRDDVVACSHQVLELVQNHDERPLLRHINKEPEDVAPTAVVIRLELTVTPPGELVKELDSVLIRGSVRGEKVKESLRFRPRMIEQKGLSHERDDDEHALLAQNEE